MQAEISRAHLIFQNMTKIKLLKRVALVALLSMGTLCYAQRDRTGTPASGAVSVQPTAVMNSLSAALKNPNQVRRLDLSGQNLTSISDSIGLLANLVELNLGRNKLTSLPISVGELRKLDVLNISNNNFTELPAAIREMVHLDVLNISNNPIKELDERAFSGLNNLKELRMDFVKVSALPTSLASCLTLATFSAEGNNLKALPAFFGNLKLLKHINVNKNDITVLADIIFMLPDLETLTVSANELRGLPDGIGGSKLKTLEADSNGIDEIPTSIGDCKNLERLSMVHNRLKTLPIEIGRCKNLGFLDISGNDLTSLPVKELASLPALSVLRIANRPEMQKK